MTSIVRRPGYVNVMWVSWITIISFIIFRYYYFFFLLQQRFKLMHSCSHTPIFLTTLPIAEDNFQMLFTYSKYLFFLSGTHQLVNKMFMSWSLSRLSLYQMIPDTWWKWTTISAGPHIDPFQDHQMPKGLLFCNRIHRNWIASNS